MHMNVIRRWPRQTRERAQNGVGENENEEEEEKGPQERDIDKPSNQKKEEVC